MSCPRWQSVRRYSACYAPLKRIETGCVLLTDQDKIGYYEQRGLGDRTVFGLGFFL